MAVRLEGEQGAPTQKLTSVEIPQPYIITADRRRILPVHMYIPDGAEVKEPDGKHVINYGRLHPIESDLSSVVVFDASLDENYVREQVATYNPFNIHP